MLVVLLYCYIHFFRYSKSAIYLKNSNILKTDSLDNYVLYMCANIPNEILDKYFGYGIYNSVNIKVNNEGNIPIPEYAIPKKLFNNKYIIEINDSINYKYENDEEYYKYLRLLDELYSKHNNYKVVLKVLMNNKLSACPQAAYTALRMAEKIITIRIKLIICLKFCLI